MNLPTEITLRDLYYTPAIRERVNNGELVARVRGTVHPVVDIAYGNLRYRVWLKGFEKPMVYRGNKRVVISAE